MFSFFKKKPVPPAPPSEVPVLAETPIPQDVVEVAVSGPLAVNGASVKPHAGAPGITAHAAPSEANVLPPPASPTQQAPSPETSSASPDDDGEAAPQPTGPRGWLRNPFARPAAALAPAPQPTPAPDPRSALTPSPVPAPVSAAPHAPAFAALPPTVVPVAPPVSAAAPQTAEPPAAHGTTPSRAATTAPEASAPAGPALAARAGWMDRLRGGLRKTSSSIATVFTGTRIDDALYEELEDALLMADTGVKATAHLLVDLKRRVKDSRATDPAAVKGLLIDALTELLRPLERRLVIGEFTPTVIMVAGVNGAGKTTSIGKLTRHLAQAGASVLLAAADTFRAAAREQLGVWADRNTVEIISQEGGDPAAVSYDAVTAGRARRKDVVLIDTAGRLPTQLHLMEELRKIKRTIVKAGAAPGLPGMGEPPHEVLLVIDGNTGQNALAQVRSFDDALQLTGLIVTKLDGTAKGGVLAAIAQERPLPVYFIGVGEKLEDLETFSAREFAQALLT